MSGSHSEFYARIKYQGTARNKDGALDQRFVVPVRTELQISGWEGPEGIRATTRAAKSDGGRTILFATPPPWTKKADCLDDWKAFDDGGMPAIIAEALCGACPVIGECLAQAMTEEGTQLPRFRSGVRGGLNAVDRFSLAVGDKSCAQGHEFKKFGKIKADGAAYCGECARLGDKRRYHEATSSDPRHERIACPRCSASILKRNKSRHMKTADCEESLHRGESAHG